MKFECVCGHTFTLTDIPSRDTFRIYDDDGLDILIRRIVNEYRGSEITAEEFYYQVDDVLFARKEKIVEAIECPLCKRLNVIAGNQLRLAYRREALPSTASGSEAPDLYALLQEVDSSQS